VVFLGDAAVMAEVVETTLAVVEERKHRHIMKVGLSLLAHASMPLKYWDEAFLAGTYLINRIPTKDLDFSSPLEILFKEKPNYGGLRTFGCARWPNLKPLILTRSNSVSSNASFLGIATYTRVSSVLILLKGGFTYLVMLSSMTQFTPSANLILMQVLIFNLKFFFYRLIPHLVFVDANLWMIQLLICMLTLWLLTPCVLMQLLKKKIWPKTLQNLPLFL
jgi:hypothetical protein